MLKEFKFINASNMRKSLQLATLLFEDGYKEGKYLLKWDIKKNAFPSISKDLIQKYYSKELEKWQWKSWKEEVDGADDSSEGINCITIERRG